MQLRRPQPSTLLFLALTLAGLGLAVLATPARAAPNAVDKSLSPYFFVEGASPGVEALPLEATRADVKVAGVIADVAVTQTYRNDGEVPINARYVFPASTRAAVYGMKMTIGNRVIVAKIKERAQARREYEEAKAAGKSASLLEEDRPNVFSMNVANILPGDRIEVELRYTELLVPTAGVYELIYPTVVGPRYASGGTDPTAPENKFIASPYLHAGKDPVSTFDIKVSVAAGMAIQSLDSPTHAIQTSWASNKNAADIKLDRSETAGGNRDFVLRYTLGGTDIATGMLLYPGKDENFFLMMVQPPRRPTPDQIPPREYVFILDVSGSMNGFPMDVSKNLMRDLLGRMRPVDRFNVLLFAGASSLYADASVPATPKEITNAIAFIDAQEGGGGTELLPALQRALALPRPTAGVSRSFVVVTDGYISEEAAMFDHIRLNLNRANVFSFGIGSGVNRHLVDGVARAGQGESFVVLDASEGKAAAARFRQYVEAPVLTEASVSFEGFDAYDIEPPVLPDVFAERPVVIFGKYRGAPQGKVKLSGVSGRGRFVNTFDVSKFSPSSSNQALRYLWARARISELSDFSLGDENRDEVVKLGLEYNLLTKYTSFIAIQHVVRAGIKALDVDQPSAIPEGVEDSAMGMEVGPEPPLTWLLAIVLLALAWPLRRKLSVARWSRS